MKEIVFLGGLLVILLYALGLTQERGKERDYKVISSRTIGRYGDTLVVEQIMVKQ